MTLSEFSDEFDVLYNNITSNQAPGLDEYEKSVFLTKAQDEILLAYFDPRGNKVQEGFDDSQRRQIDFSNITETADYTFKILDENNKIVEATNSPGKSAQYDHRSNSISVNIPSDILTIVNEKLSVFTSPRQVKYLTVVPIQYSEYDRLMSKPFQRPLKNQAWRMLNSSCADLIVGPGEVIKTYHIRYIRRPNPIILGNLDGLTINGMTGPQECEVDPILHHEILQRAIEFAKAAYTGDVQTQVGLGTASQTPIGVVPQASR